MTAQYWSQWSSAEILSIHGIEHQESYCNENEEIEAETQEDQNFNRCPRCWGGCNYCLMY